MNNFGGITLKKREYETPEFDFVRILLSCQILTTVSGEGDPNQIVEKEDGDDLN